jgi:hypothetical protein
MTPLYYFADFILHDDRVNQYVGDDGSGGEKSSSVHESGFHDDGNPINISDCSKCLMTAKSAIFLFKILGCQLYDSVILSSERSD